MYLLHLDVIISLSVAVAGIIIPDHLSHLPQEFRREMMRDSRLEEEDDDDVDSQKEEKGMGQKGNPRRSKHSETEQRRRLKINERFQVLMDLIPQNDQKRDKASFLLEVIQYIQFLQANLNMYEGWSPEPSKLVPREDNYMVSPSMLINAQNPVNPKVAEAVAYTGMDHSTVSANQAMPIHAVTQSSVLGNVPNQTQQSSLDDRVFQGSHSRSQFCQTRPCITESDLPSYALSEEEPSIRSGEASISNAYSQGLLNNLTQALRSSGVDLRQASISVQLDVGKRGDSGLPSTMFSAKDNQNQCRDNQTRTTGVVSSREPSDRAEKRPKTSII